MEDRKTRRFGDRYNVIIRNTPQDFGTAADNRVNAFTHDISLTGARIYTKVDFPIGRVLRIVIVLKNANRIVSVDGKVIWTKRSEDDEHLDIGVEFLHILPDTVLALIDHLYGKKDRIPSSVS